MNRVYIMLVYTLFGCILAIIYSLKRYKTIHGRIVDYSPQIYNPGAIPFALAAMVLLMIAAGFSVLDTLYGVVLPVLTDLFFYYLMLILLSGVLRKVFSGKLCAALWVLPNIMHLFVFPQYRPIPEVVISLGDMSAYILVIWFIGFVLVMGSRIAAHLVIRKRLLSDCSDEIDPFVFELWKEELASSEAKVNANVLKSSHSMTAPLTIGLFSVRLILPNRKYTEEQLRLIFRHELVHICKQDCWTKFFLDFCSALCWFNPLMWLAMKKCAADLERSCDEAVLTDADDKERMLYSELILQESAEEKGFTSCLSSSFQSLRYRLKRIQKPKKVRFEGLLLFIVSAIMAVFIGKVGFSFGTSQLKTLQLSEQKQLLKVHAESWYTGAAYQMIQEFEASDGQKVIQELADLKLEKISNVFSESGEHRLNLTIVFENERTSIDLIETPNGLIIYEQSRKKNDLKQTFFCQEATLDSFVDLLVSVESKEGA